jgi:hypothetical protein
MKYWYVGDKYMHFMTTNNGKVVLQLPVIVRIKASMHHTVAKSIEEIPMV